MRGAARVQRIRRIPSLCIRRGMARDSAGVCSYLVFTSEKKSTHQRSVLCYEDYGYTADDWPLADNGFKARFDEPNVTGALPLRFGC